MVLVALFLGLMTGYMLSELYKHSESEMMLQQRTPLLAKTMAIAPIESEEVIKNNTK